jgi:hypothetical protein
MRQPYHDIVPRDDNMYDLVSGDTRGEKPAPAPIAKFRSLKIRGVRFAASA